jgi:tRNA pseudouridine13 synthase
MAFDPPMPPVPSDLIRPIPGRIREVPEDFLVEEIPLYPPTGEGEHLMVLVEKREVTTGGMIARLAAGLRIPPRSIGCAGLKDRHGVTRQWVTLPARAASALDSLEIPGIRILESHSHRNKLKTGHLKGNRFTIVVRGTPPGADATARAVLDRLTREGLANAFGPQRFGARADNHVLGEALVRGEATRFLDLCATPLPGVETPRVIEARRLLGNRQFAEALALFPKEFPIERHLALALQKSPDDIDGAARTLPRRPRDFLISAWQSACFNEVLRARLDVPALLLPGDVAMKLQNGACFLVQDPERELPRAQALEVSATGPMPGRKLLRPTAEAGRIEAAVLASFGWPPAPVSGRDPNPFPGARRALRVFVTEASATTDPEGHLVLRFTLPRGSFATSLLACFGLGGGG